MNLHKESSLTVKAWEEHCVWLHVPPEMYFLSKEGQILICDNTNVELF